MNPGPSGVWTVAASGRVVHPFNLKLEEVCIEDIALSLSQKCRYGGMCRKFWSVSQHSLLGVDIARRAGLSEQVQLDFLLHDAAEAYLGDIQTPLKSLLAAVYDYCNVSIKCLEHRALTTIRKALGVSGEPDHATIKQIDHTCLVREWIGLMPGNVPDGYADHFPDAMPYVDFGGKFISHESVKDEFLEMFELLCSQIKTRTCLASP